MTTLDARATTPAKRAKPTKGSNVAKPKSSGTTATAKSTTENRVTKHDCILSLLSRRDGATIAEMMETTGWQQHSVRGFLAGTVKKEAWLHSRLVKDLRRTAPLPHRSQAGPLT